MAEDINSNQSTTSPHDFLVTLSCPTQKHMSLQVVRLQCTSGQHEISVSVVLPSCIFPAWAHDMLVLPPPSTVQSCFSGQESGPGVPPAVQLLPQQAAFGAVTAVVGLSNNTVHALSLVGGDAEGELNSGPGPQVTHAC
jgi:hypothetical protein